MHPNVKPFCKKGFPFYEQIQQLFSMAIATGQGVFHLHLEGRSVNGAVVSVSTTWVVEVEHKQAECDEDTGPSDNEDSLQSNDKYDPVAIINESVSTKGNSGGTRLEHDNSV
jgi:hypothetical protein